MRMKMNRMHLFSIVGAIVFLMSSTIPVLASKTEKMKPNPERGGFDMAPGSFGVEVNAGDTFKQTIQVTNWSGKTSRFKVEVEDFEGSKTVDNSGVVLQGANPGRFSARDWVKPEFWEFSMDREDRMWFDVEVTVPKNADSGDHYASVLVTMLADPVKDDQKTDKKQSNVAIQSRVGVLMFLRVRGPIKESGELQSFAVWKKWYEKTPVDFTSVFKNDGTVRLKPEGKIEIKNWFGNVVETIPVETYNVLRDSVRAMNYHWEKKGFHIGKYTAVLSLNRGYENAVDVKVVTFWMIPWKQILITLLILLVVYKTLRFVGSKFEVRRKPRGDGKE